jgi:23S rRNA U2552 (ribose-2'-O)-methylase RlmE/FtsJ
MRERERERNLILKLFFKSKNYSTKYSKYFSVYNDLFKKYINQKIVFVEIGVLNGGSLELWRSFFGKKARIIGVDINPDCKKFKKKGIEIFIGDQSDPRFWKNFFKKIGKCDVVLDDGGHTNAQQIVTAISCIPNIKNNGMHVCEDTHTSYLQEFNNPSKYSFIEYTKKLIDDVNFTFPNLFKFKFSLNKFIYSIQTYESVVCFHIDRSRCKINKRLNNKKIYHEIKDYRYGANKYEKLRLKFQYLKKIYFLRRIIDILRLVAIKIKNKLRNKGNVEYFK